MPMPDALTAAEQRAAARDAETDAGLLEWRLLVLNLVGALERLDAANRRVAIAQEDARAAAQVARRMLRETESKEA